jgi:hypothetical protein
MTTSLLGSAVLSLFRLTGDMVARGKGYLKNLQPPPSSLLPAATENIAAAVTSKPVDLKCHDIAKDGMKATDAASSSDESFSFPRFDVLQITPEDHHYLDHSDQVMLYFYKMNNCRYSGLIRVMSKKKVRTHL